MVPAGICGRIILKTSTFSLILTFLTLSYSSLLEAFICFQHIYSVAWSLLKVRHASPPGRVALPAELLTNVMSLFSTPVTADKEKRLNPFPILFDHPL